MPLATQENTSLTPISTTQVGGAISMPGEERGRRFASSTQSNQKQSGSALSQTASVLLDERANRMVLIVVVLAVAYCSDKQSKKAYRNNTRPHSLK